MLVLAAARVLLADTIDTVITRHNRIPWWSSGNSRAECHCSCLQGFIHLQASAFSNTSYIRRCLNIVKVFTETKSITRTTNKSPQPVEAFPAVWDVPGESRVAHRNALTIGCAKWHVLDPLFSFLFIFLPTYFAELVSWPHFDSSLITELCCFSSVMTNFSHVSISAHTNKLHSKLAKVIYGSERLCGCDEISMSSPNYPWNSKSRKDGVWVMPAHVQ